MKVSNLERAKLTTKKLLDLVDKCSNKPALKRRFVLMSVKFVILLTETFTIDLTEEIINYTQIFDPKTQEAFNNAISLLKKTISRLETKVES